MKIIPLNDRVIIKKYEQQKKSAGGIILSENDKKKELRGKVIAVGKGKTLNNGSIKAMNVKEGDKIIYNEFSGTVVTINSKELLIVNEEDIIAIIK